MKSWLVGMMVVFVILAVSSASAETYNVVDYIINDTFDIPVTGWVWAFSGPGTDGGQWVNNESQATHGWWSVVNDVYYNDHVNNGVSDTEPQHVGFYGTDNALLIQNSTLTLADGDTAVMSFKLKKDPNNPIMPQFRAFISDAYAGGGEYGDVTYATATEGVNSSTWTTINWSYTHSGATTSALQLAFEAINSGTGSNEYIWMDTIGIPEPMTITLLGSGCVFMLLKRKR